MATYELETLQITIEAQANQAKSAIRSLRASLLLLQKTAEDIDFKKIDIIHDALERVASVDFSNVSQGLEKVVNALNSVNEYTATRTKNVAKILEGAKLSETQSIFAPQTLQTLDKVRIDLQDISNNLLPAISKQSGMSFGGKQGGFGGFDFGGGEQGGSWFSQFKDAFKDLFASIIDNPAVLASKLFNIVFYRIIRSGLSLIVNTIKKTIEKVIQTIKKGLDNLYKQSKEQNGSYAKTIDNLTKTFDYVVNSLATIVFPFIQAIEPLLTFFMSESGIFFNLVGSLVQALFGVESFTQAQKSLDDTTDQLKENAKLSLGIDELNVSNQEQTMSMFSGINSELNGLAKALTQITNEIETILNDDLQMILDMLNPVRQAIKGIWDIVNGLIGMVMSLITLLTIGGDKAWEQFKNGIASFLNGIINALSSIPNMLIAVVNKLTSLISSVLGIFGVPAIPQIPLIPEANISFARGGFPEDGLFFANSGELVGRFANGRTAVANNEQITTGIYNAVLQAMNQSQFGSGNNIKVYMDSKEIATRVEERQKAKGLSNFKGSVVKYGV